MGLITRAKGIASDVDVAKLQAEFEPLMAEAETLQAEFVIDVEFGASEAWTGGMLTPDRFSSIDLV